MESDKNIKTLRWVEDHASIIDDDYENRIPKVQFQKNVKVRVPRVWTTDHRSMIFVQVWTSSVKVKPYKPSAKPSSLGKKHSIVQDIDNEFDVQFRDTRTLRTGWMDRLGLSSSCISESAKAFAWKQSI